METDLEGFRVSSGLSLRIYLRFCTDRHIECLCEWGGDPTIRKDIRYDDLYRSAGKYVG